MNPNNAGDSTVQVQVQVQVVYCTGRAIAIRYVLVMHVNDGVPRLYFMTIQCGYIIFQIENHEDMTVISLNQLFLRNMYLQRVVVYYIYIIDLII